MSDDIATRLIDFTVKTKFEQIPKETLDFTKYLTLKTVAGMLAGAVKPSSRKMTKIISNQKLPTSFGVVGCGGFRSSLWEAIFLNSYYAHVSELEDDRHSDGGASWDITVIPVVLSLAEKLGVSGKAVLEALVVGLEVHARTCLFSTRHLGLYLVPAAVGPAAGAARTLGLDAEKTASALGIALSAVPIAQVNFGTDAHFFESSMECLQAVMAAEMAQAGLTGNPDIATYLKRHLGEEWVVPERIVEDLGERWIFQEIEVKKYPCCTFTHRQIDLVIELMREHGLSHDAIAAVEVHGSPADTIVSRPEPKSDNDILFSLQHLLAAAMVYGDVSFEQTTPEAFADPKLKALRAKVQFVLHPELSDIMFKEPARVVIKTKDGKEFSRARQFAIGNPKDPLTLEQHKALYAKFAKGILREDQISKTLGMILNMEKLDNVNELMDILTEASLLA